jgi:hypothetical protein
MASSEELPRPRRKVGAALGIAIVFLPWVFAWFTLRRGHGILARVLAFGWAIATVAIVAQSNPTSANMPAVIAAAPPAASFARAAPSTVRSPPPSHPSKWSYSEDKDRMRGTVSKFAIVTSSNALHFGFPYGSHTGDLILRRRPEDGLQIMLKVTGQFICSEFTRSYISAKFDDGRIERYGCSRPSDASTGLIFIRSQQRFLRKLKAARSVIVEAEYFQNGNQQLRFEVAGLEGSF